MDDEERKCKRCGVVEGEDGRFIGFHESLRGNTVCDSCAEEVGCRCCLLHLSAEEREQRFIEEITPTIMDMAHRPFAPAPPAGKPERSPCYGCDRLCYGCE